MSFREGSFNSSIVADARSQKAVSRKMQAHERVPLLLGLLKACTGHVRRCYHCCAWMTANQMGTDECFGHAIDTMRVDCGSISLNVGVHRRYSTNALLRRKETLGGLCTQHARG